MNPALIAKDVAEKRNFSNVNEIVSKKRFSNDICQMKISFILYVFQFFIKNQHLTSHGIIYVFVDFLNFYNLTFHGIMYVFVDFCKKIFLLLISISAKKFFLLTSVTSFLTSIFYTSGMHNQHLYNIRPHPAAVHESSVRLLRRFPHVLRNIQHHPAVGLTLPVRHFPDCMSYV